MCHMYSVDVASHNHILQNKMKKKSILKKYVLKQTLGSYKKQHKKLIYLKSLDWLFNFIFTRDKLVNEESQATAKTWLIKWQFNPTPFTNNL